MENSEDFKKKLYEFFFILPKDSGKDTTSHKYMSSKHGGTTATMKTADLDSDSYSALGKRNAQGAMDEDERRKRL